MRAGAVEAAVCFLGLPAAPPGTTDQVWVGIQLGASEGLWDVQAANLERMLNR